MLAVVLFYIPSAIVVVHLSRRMPLEGGLYQWAKISRFGARTGFMVAWNLWIYAAVLMSSIGVHAATAFAYATGIRSDCGEQEASSDRRCQRFDVMESRCYP